MAKKKLGSDRSGATKGKKRNRVHGACGKPQQGGVNQKTKLLNVTVVALLPAVARLVLAVPEDYDDSQEEALVDVVRWEIGPGAFRPDDIEVYDVLSTEITLVDGDGLPNYKVVRTAHGELELDYSDDSSQR